MVRSLYLSSWYNSNLEVQKLVLLMMNRSQNTRYFSAGGLVDINIKAFGNVSQNVRNKFDFICNGFLIVSGDHENIYSLCFC